jgi:putative ABC transport system permease protein
VDVPTPVAVISHALWKRAFGLDPQILGRRIEVSDQPFTIVGVAAEGFAGLDLSRTGLFLPVNTYTGQSSTPGVPFHRGGGDFFRVVARLAAGADELGLAARGTPARRTYREAVPELRPFDWDATAFLVTGSVVEARGPGPRDRILAVPTRAGGVTLIGLLIACANVASLLLVRATRRRREIAVRLALGVSRGRLLTQMIVESLLLAALAGGTAVFVAVWGGGVLRRLLLPAVSAPPTRPVAPSSGSRRTSAGPR